MVIGSPGKGHLHEKVPFIINTRKGRFIFNEVLPRSSTSTIISMKCEKTIPVSHLIKRTRGG